MDESLLKIGIIVILIYIICYLNNNNQNSQQSEQQQKQQQVVEGFNNQQVPQQARQQVPQQPRQQAPQQARQQVPQQPRQQVPQQPRQQVPQQQQPVRASVQSEGGNASVQSQRQQQARERGITGQSRETSGNAVPQGVESVQQAQQAAYQASSNDSKVDAAGNVINTCGNDILTSAELLPSDVKTTWSEVTPVNPGGLESKNFLDAGFHIGINTVGQSMRNANRQLRSDPPIPKVEVSIWNRSTIEADDNRRPLEIGGACEN